MLRRLVAPVLLAACLTGCASGLLYTHVTVPLDLNLEQVPAQQPEGKRDWKTFAYIVRFDWDSAAIVDAAREAGLTEIYYADLEIFSVFFGVWQQRTARVYGTGP